MKVWFHKVHESRRSFVDVAGDTVTIGRDVGNTLVLKSPLISRRHMVVKLANGELKLDNVGLNSCVVGEAEVLGGQSQTFKPGVPVRIWPYTITFESESAPLVTRADLEAHLRTTIAELELRIHRQLLERLDLLDSNTTGDHSRERILLLESNVEDLCRELSVFAKENDPLLEEMAGLALRDHLIQQLVMEVREDEWFDLTQLTANEMDLPATLIPERESELHNLLLMLRKLLAVADEPDVSHRVRRIEEGYADAFPKIRPHLHAELRRYIILRMLKKDLKDIVFGFGPIQDLLRAPSVTEIMVVSRDQIYVERDGVIENSGRRFISNEVTESVIERIVAQVGRRIDKSQPLVDARLPDGSRVNAVIPPLATKGPCLTIRKFPAQRFTIEDLIEMGSIPRPAAAFLRACVIESSNILISGGTGTGKTTFLNVLSSFIPFKQRVVTIEDTTELRLHQEHVVPLESKLANVEGAGAYPIRDLLKNALRMRPDRIIVGECRGPEALDMLQAMNTGHDGSMTTVHANSAEEVLQRLEVLVLMAADLPIVSIHRQIESAIDLIVHISRMPGGKRLVTQISEVGSLDPETNRVTIRDIFNMSDGRGLQPTGFLPSFVDKLIERQLLELQDLFPRRIATPLPAAGIGAGFVARRLPHG